MAGRHRTARASNPRRALATLLTAVAIAAAWVAVGVSGAGGTLAAWSSSVTVPGATLHTGSAALQLGGFDKLAATFSSGTLASTVAAVTVTNTGTAPLRTFTTKAAVVGSTTLAGAVDVSIWPLGTAASCGAAPAGTAATAWNAAPNWLATQAALAPGATATYCVLSTMAQGAPAQYPGLTAELTVSVTATTATGGAGWSATQSAPAFALSTAAAAATTHPVTPGQVGVANGTTGTVVSVDLPTDDSVWASTPNGNIDAATSRIGNQYHVCMVFAVQGTTTAASDWNFTINTAVAPFNGAALSQSSFAPEGAQTARIVSFPSGSSHSYTIGGIHQGSATAIDQLVYGDTRAPDGYQDHTWTTPLAKSQTAHVHLCVDVHTAAPVAKAGSATYTVDQPVLAGCPAGGANPATAAGAAALSSAIPTGGNGAAVCLYVTVRGLYPHFYIGYTATADWTAAVNGSTKLTQRQKTALLTASPTGAMVYGSDDTATSAGAPTLSKGIFTWTETDQHTPLAITDGIDVVLALTFTLPAA